MKRTAVVLLLLAFSMQAQQQPAQTGKAIGEVTLFGEEQPKVEAATKTVLRL